MPRVVDLWEGELPTPIFPIRLPRFFVAQDEFCDGLVATSLRHVVRKLQIAMRKLTGDSLEHFGVRREFFHEHQKTLDRFLRFVTSEATADKIDFLQLPWL